MWKGFKAAAALLLTFPAVASTQKSRRDRYRRRCTGPFAAYAGAGPGR